MAPQPSDTAPSATSGPTLTASALAANPPPAGPLSPAQIAGIAVGGAAFCFIIITIIALLASHARRKKRSASTTGHSSKLGSTSTVSRFGNSDKEMAPPFHPRDGPVAEKSTTPPPIRPNRPTVRTQPTVKLPHPGIDPTQIGVAVSPESQNIDRTPVSAQSTDSHTKLLPKLPPANLKVAIPRNETQRLRPDGSTFPGNGPPRPDMSAPRAKLPSAPQSPRSPENSVELPCNNPRRSLNAPLKVKIPPPVAARDAPPLPTIKKQSADRSSVQTLISAEPMSPVDPTHTALRPEMAPFLDPALGYIPSYYYSSNMTPNQPTFSSPLHQTTFPVSATDGPSPVSPPTEPRTPIDRITQPTRAAPYSASPTLVNSVSPPSRPQRRTPPPLPPPPKVDPVASSRATAEQGSSLRSVYSIATPRQPPPKSRQGPPPVAPPMRRATGDSHSSDTSFETSMSDEVTPEDEEPTKTLPTVPEVTTPVTGLKYPKVPRASNQAVARRSPSPPQPQPQPRPRQPSASSRAGSPAGSTLVGKRKGSDAEDDLKRGLWITDSNGRTAKGRFPVRASVHAGGEVAMPASASPRSGSQLTPKRTPRGDLVLEVE